MNAVLDEELDEKWPQRLLDIFAHLEQDLGKDHSEKKARELAQRCVLAVADVAGGHPIYIPQAHHLKIALRDQKMFEEFNGHNYFELAAKYKKSESQIRKVIEIQRKLAVAKRQGSLL